MLDNSFSPRLEGALEALIQSNSILQTFFDNAPHMMGIVEIVGGDILHIADNLPTARFFGQDPEVLCGRTASSLGVEPNELRVWIDHYLESERSGHPIRFEYTHPTEAGLRWLCTTVSFAGRPLVGNPRFCYIVEDITERKEAEQALALARDAALEASKLKSEFLGTVSHELRSPLNGVIGIAEVLLDTPLAKEQAELANIILNSGQELLSIINDILDFSSIEAGKLVLDNKPFELFKLIAEVTVETEAKVREKNLVFRTSLAPEIPACLTGDSLKLKQILLKLTSNAIKFSDKGEVLIGVEVMTVQKELVLLKFMVKDEGIGLSATAKKRLFQPFTQADGSITRKFGGTGLGLVITKKLVELMSGEIGVESEEGCGATFWFIVPFRLEVTAVKVASQPNKAD